MIAKQVATILHISESCSSEQYYESHWLNCNAFNRNILHHRFPYYRPESFEDKIAVNAIYFVS